MYAIIRAGGKQYRVEKGDVVRVERLEGEVGSSVTLDEVLFVSAGGATSKSEAPRSRALRSPAPWWSRAAAPRSASSSTRSASTTGGRAVTAST